jgi:group I intron endonuclease
MESLISLQNISGIYKITNKINGKYYIGSSNNLYERWSYHITHLTKNIHHNKYLQSSWNKYGKDNFIFSLIEKVEKYNLLITEQKYLDKLKKDKKNCYNLTFIAGGGGGFEGKHHSEESKNKISLKLTGKYKGTNSPHYGKHHSEKTKKKLSLLKLGKPSPNKGKKLSKEQKIKIKNSLLKIRDDISKRFRKTYTFVSPNNEIITITNLKEFCKFNNLTYSRMSGVGRRVEKSHKGWRLQC